MPLSSSGPPVPVPRSRTLNLAVLGTTGECGPGPALSTERRARGLGYPQPHWGGRWRKGWIFRTSNVAGLVPEPGWGRVERASGHPTLRRAQMAGP